MGRQRRRVRSSAASIGRRTSRRRTATIPVTTTAAPITSKRHDQPAKRSTFEKTSWACAKRGRATFGWRVHGHHRDAEPMTAGATLRTGVPRVAPRSSCGSASIVAQIGAQWSSTTAIPPAKASESLSQSPDYSETNHPTTSDWPFCVGTLPSAWRGMSTSTSHAEPGRAVEGLLVASVSWGTATPLDSHGG